jgi:hypothetical protein
MKTIFFLLMCQIAISQTVIDESEISFDRILFGSTITAATENISLVPIYKVTIENRIDTLEMEWIIIAGPDGILRKERHITILKEYGKVSDIFGTYNPTYLKYSRLNGEILDVVFLKEANYDYIISGN